MRDFGIDQGLRNDANHFAACVKRRIGNRTHQAEPPAAIDDPDPTPRKFGTDAVCSIDIDGIGRGRRTAVNSKALQRFVSRMTAIARAIGTGGLPDNIRALSRNVVLPA